MLQEGRGKEWVRIGEGKYEDGEAKMLIEKKK
jgi:hypothetical protein